MGTGTTIEIIGDQCWVERFPGCGHGCSEAVMETLIGGLQGVGQPRWSSDS